MSKLKKVLIMTGGTGGHVFPGLAVARQLREQGIDVEWLGTRAGLEAKLVPEAHIPLHFITISGIRGKGFLNLLFAPAKLIRAIIQSKKLIQEINPDVILGMGGFVSGPGGIAAWLLKRPLVIHEQNAIPGTTNKWLAKVAKKILEGFPSTFQHQHNVVTTGNPVRTEIANLPSPDIRFAREKNNSLKLLVVGGSLGAAKLNQVVPKALASLPSEVIVEVVHQCGEKNNDETQKAYAELKVAAEIKPFIKEMDKAYEWADIVLCRAGASTVSELCAAGLGAIFVPFPLAIDDHQTRNAQYMVNNKAALLIQQRDLTVEGLAGLLKELYAKREKCVAMARAAYRLRKVDATKQVFKICEEICT